MSPDKLILSITLLIISAHAVALDLETFRSLDPIELRAAEAAMDEYIEAGTMRALRAPRNAAERYVLQRQQRLAAEFNRRSATATLRQGAQAQALFWPAARASRVSIGPQGQVAIQCQPARSMLGQTPPDFRQGNPPVRALR
jgi:hypothetical protein